MLASIINNATDVSLNPDFNWSIGDYLMALLLIGGMISLIYIVYKKKSESKYRNLIFIAVVLFTVIIWMDLAVGLFGLPWSGS